MNPSSHPADPDSFPPEPPSSRRAQVGRKVFRPAAIWTICVLAASTALAGAVRTDAGFTANNLPANDDGSTGLVNIGFTIDLFGNSYNQLYINNNGNVTFDASLGTFTPFNLLSTGVKILAPFFGDVDTRGVGSDILTYGFGNGTVGGNPAFGVNWINVGYFNSHVDKLNSFQLILIDRSDIAPGDFDFEFNYDQIQWETGDASGGTVGLGGSPARAGWSDGSVNSYEIAGAGTTLAYLDSSASGLIYHSLNSGTDGRYLFSVRSGVVPEPSSMALLASGMIGLASYGWRLRRSRRRSKA